MEREFKYLVLKFKDIAKYLSEPDQMQLMGLAGIISIGRELEQKRPLECVCVEDDWPEYEKVWQMIAARVDGTEMTPTNLSELRAQVEAAREPVAWLWKTHGWIVTAHSKHRGIQHYVDICQPSKAVKQSDDFISLAPLYTLDPQIAIQLIDRLEAAKRDAAQLRTFIDTAFEVHPNLALDVEAAETHQEHHQKD